LDPEHYEEEVESLQLVLGKAAEEPVEEAALEDDAHELGPKKRKRRVWETRAQVKKRTKQDSFDLFVEGYSWLSGTALGKRDPIRGEVLVEAAADEGVAFAEACCILNAWGGREQDEDAAFARFRELAECAGEQQVVVNSVAMTILGYCYMYGGCVTKDYVKAVECYTTAARKGDCTAMSMLGHCYEHGLGVDSDLDKAEEFYSRGSEPQRPLHHQDPAEDTMDSTTITIGGMLASKLARAFPPPPGGGACAH
jgi:TPR repeat protein